MTLDLPNSLEEKDTPEEGPKTIPKPGSAQSCDDHCINDVVSMNRAVMPDNGTQERGEEERLVVSIISLKEPAEQPEATHLCQYINRRAERNRSVRAERRSCQTTKGKIAFNPITIDRE